MRMAMAVTAMLIALLLMGCQTQLINIHGNPAILDEQAVGRIQEGVSTASDAIDAMAKPASVTFEDQLGKTKCYHYSCVLSDTRWLYCISRRVHFWTGIKSYIYRLDIVLDEGGTVRKIAYSTPADDDEGRHGLMLQ